MPAEEGMLDLFLLWRKAACAAVRLGYLRCHDVYLLHKQHKEHRQVRQATGCLGVEVGTRLLHWSGSKGCYLFCVQVQKK